MDGPVFFLSPCTTLAKSVAVPLPLRVVLWLLCCLHAFLFFSFFLRLVLCLLCCLHYNFSFFFSLQNALCITTHTTLNDTAQC